MFLPAFIGKLIDDVGGPGGGREGGREGWMEGGREGRRGQRRQRRIAHPSLPPSLPPSLLVPGDKDASEARHSLDTSVVILLVVLLLGSLFTFVR